MKLELLIFFLNFSNIAFLTREKITNFFIDEFFSNYQKTEKKITNWISEKLGIFLKKMFFFEISNSRKKSVFLWFFQFFSDFSLQFYRLIISENQKKILFTVISFFYFRTLMESHLNVFLKPFQRNSGSSSSRIPINFPIPQSFKSYLKKSITKRVTYIF